MEGEDRSYSFCEGSDYSGQKRRKEQSRKIKVRAAFRAGRNIS